MASSSVSQDDFDKNDYEKLERRSRIRTARARQINPQVYEAIYGRYLQNPKLVTNHSIASI